MDRMELPKSPRTMLPAEPVRKSPRKTPQKPQAGQKRTSVSKSGGPSRKLFRGDSTLGEEKTKSKVWFLVWRKKGNVFIISTISYHFHFLLLRKSKAYLLEIIYLIRMCFLGGSWDIHFEYMISSWFLSGMPFPWIDHWAFKTLL